MSMVSRASCRRRSLRSRLLSEEEATPPLPVLPPGRCWKSMVRALGLYQTGRETAFRKPSWTAQVFGVLASELFPLVYVYFPQTKFYFCGSAVNLLKARKMLPTYFFCPMHKKSKTYLCPSRTLLSPK